MFVTIIEISLRTAVAKYGVPTCAFCPFKLQTNVKDKSVM